MISEMSVFNFLLKAAVTAGSFQFSSAMIVLN